MAEMQESRVNTDRWNENAVRLTESPLARAHRRLMVWLSRFPALAKPDHALLDFGCGAGPFLKHFKSLGFSRLSGVEPDSALVAQIPKGLADVRVGAGEKLPFPDASFDVVWVYCVLHHLERLPAYRAACGEIDRVLKPGGLVFINEPGRYRVFLALEAVAKALGSVSKTWRAFRETMDEERTLQHFFLQNHGAVRDRLLELGFSPLVDDYVAYSWIFTARKPGA